MTHPTLRWLLPVLVMLPMGCATQGIARGELESAAARPQGPVVFSWRSDGTRPTSGTMLARLPTGKTFEGPYVEPGRESEGFGTLPADIPLGPDFDAAFNLRPCADGPMDDEFMGRCTGHLLAALQADDGTRLWCNLTLKRPTAGPAGGGTGRCQLSNGEQIDDVELYRTN
jgi:hypothetical protein